MLRQFIIQHQAFETSKDLNTSNTLDIQRYLLNDIVRENHLLYHMEKRDRPNNLIRVLIEFHKLGATQEQLSIAYQKTLLDVEPIPILQNRIINPDNWQEFLGIKSSYGDYLLFFDSQLSLLGLEETLETYFYTIQDSIGSQLQPLVQLAFGIEHDLPDLITQALAYHASSYLDVSSILDYLCPPQNKTNNKRDKPSSAVDHILFDFISADPRFDGKIEGDNTFQSTIKLLLKSKTELIMTYMQAWSSQAMTVDERIEALIHSAISLSKASASKERNAVCQLDWFLAGGQLMSSILAIQHIIPAQHIEHWLHLQFLTMLCTFIAQGRPKYLHSMLTETCWDDCRLQVVQGSFDDPKLILAFTSVLKVRHQFPQFEHDCLEIANLLAQFSTQDGTWVKGGLGWLN
ncbi:MAG: hypothetical protein EXX96DRAFT_543197 [Benjaminiella poitrasii]|nr:MAG: hypothetical protein EXX96DRAFT_543197 [Benjaminiella poitrasii]